jgi:hypothetical protein
MMKRPRCVILALLTLLVLTGVQAQPVAHAKPLTPFVASPEKTAVPACLSPCMPADAVSTATPSLPTNTVRTATPSLSADTVWTVALSLSNHGVRTTAPSLSNYGVRTTAPSLSNHGVRTTAPSFSNHGVGTVAPSLFARAQGHQPSKSGTRLTPSTLSKPDRNALQQASQIAAHNPNRAAIWLRDHAHGTRTAVSPDGTILVHLDHGGRVAIVENTPTALPLVQPHSHRFHPAIRVHSASAINRALVLEPFADELALGVSAGQQEADALTHAGFSVDVKRNAEVTVPVMESIANYSAVYMETHSGILPNGDAIVVTGDTNFAPYSALAPVDNGGDGSLMQALVAGDPTHKLYIAVTSTFVKLHVGQFPPNSILFLNGCSLLRAPLFWQALQSHNLAALISWDQEAVVNVTEPAAAVVVTALATGSSVAGSVKAADDAGLGVAPSIPPANLGFLGNGADTIVSITRVPPTQTPAPPTATPTPPTATPTQTAAAPHFTFTLLGAKFETNQATANPSRHTLTLVKRGATVRLSIYYKAIAPPHRCTTTETFTLSRGTHRVHTWTKHVTCHSGTRRDSVARVKLTTPGVYTLSAHIVLNGSKSYSKTAHLTVK